MNGDNSGLFSFVKFSRNELRVSESKTRSTFDTVSKPLNFILQNIDESIASSYEKNYKQRKLALYEETKIEQLHEYGAPIEKLKEHGFTNVKSVKDFGIENLQKLKGIGPVSYDKAKAAILAFESAIQLHGYPQIDKWTSHDDSIIQDVLRIFQFRELYADEWEIRKSSFRDSFYLLDKFNKEFSFWNCLFSRSQRLKVLTEYSRLSDNFHIDVKKSKNFIAESVKLNKPLSEMKNMFITDSVKFIVEIESVLKRLRINVSNHAVTTTDSYLSFLPKEIVEKVNSVELQLSSLKATLRPYQIFGVKYLINQKKTLLGDDMGLGKTMQVLAAMCHLSHTMQLKRFLVVAPNSVLINWQREARKHTSFPTYVIHGKFATESLLKWLNHGGIAITTYSYCSNLMVKVRNIDFLAVDEAHAIKNPKAQRTQFIGKLSSRSLYTCYMTGTAIENRLSDMFSLLTNLNPCLKDVFGVFQEEKYPTPVNVRKAVAVAYLRRQQKEVLKELPEMIQIEEPVELTPEERNIYENSHSDVANQRLNATIGLGDLKSSKYERLQEIVETYLAENKKIVIFSFFRKVLDDICALIPDTEQINGSLSMAERQNVIDSFFNADGYAAIALQVDAGGQGINLQCAHAVILMEPQLKPSTENQAIARVMRMGQINKVTVHRLFAIDTIDESLISLLQKKDAIFEDYAAKSEIHEVSSTV